MPKAFAWILAAVTVLVLALFGLAIGVALTTQDRPSGALDTDLEGVTVSSETTPEPEPEPPPTPSREIAVAGGRSVETRGVRSHVRTRRSVYRRGSSPGRAGCTATSSSRRSTARASCT